MKKVSVLIPVYNSAKTLTRAINSVFDQTYSNFEIIIIDDGSTDETRSIIRRLVVENPTTDIQVIYHKKNFGRSVTRNSAIENSTSDYIAWLDSDDIWLPTKLERQVSLLETSTGLEQGVICGYYEVKGHTIRRVMPDPKQDGWELYCLENFDLALGITLLVNRSVYEFVGQYNPGLSRGEDFEWILRYLNSYKLIMIEEPLAIYYNDNKINPAEFATTTTTLIEITKNYYTKYGLRGQRAMSRRWIYLARLFSQEGQNHSSVIKNIHRALLIYPFQNFRTWVLLITSTVKFLRNLYSDYLSLHK